jgi:ABC-type nitrate/sulfonate/bicarbonate transport system substrate-binding protein
MPVSFIRVLRSDPVARRRRIFLPIAALATLVVLFISACGAASENASGSSTGNKVSVALGWLNNVQWAGFWMAQEQGDYKTAGVDVAFQPGGANKPDPTVLVSSGKADIGISVNMQTLMQSIANGNDFVLLGAGYQQAPSSILSLPDNPVRTPADLIGKTVLLHQGDQPNYDAMLKLAGLPTDYEASIIGYDPTVIFKGEGQALNVFATNEPITLEQEGKVEGKDFLVTTYGEMGLSQYSNVIFCTREYLENNRDAVIAFLRASAQGWHQNEADPALAAQLVIDKYGKDLDLDLAQQTRQNELQIPFTQSALTEESGLFRIDEDRLADQDYDALKAVGISNLPAVSSVVDNTVLDEAYGGDPIS